MKDYGLAFAPLAPPWLLLAFAVLALATVIAAVVLRRRGAFFRAGVFVVLLGALSGPSLVEQEREPLRDVVAVVLDRSASQDFDQRRAQTDAAREALDKALQALGGVDVRFIEAGDATVEDGEGTRLFAALNSGTADVPSERLGAVIMVTDGVVHDIPSSLAAANLKAPLHVLVTGHEGERDRRLVLVEAPRFGLIGKDVVFTVKVEEANGPGDPVAVTVSRDGAVVTRMLARPGVEFKIPVRLEHGGKNVLEFDAEPMPGELTLVNNKAAATVEGVRDHLKILLVSGEPNPGERAWRNLLKSDANVELVHFTILRPPEKQDGTPIRELALIAFPTAELFGKKIVDFDLIVFDRYSNMGLLPPAYFDNIVKYVRDGGAMAIVAGPNFAEPDGLYLYADRQGDPGASHRRGGGETLPRRAVGHRRASPGHARPAWQRQQTARLERMVPAGTGGFHAGRRSVIRHRRRAAAGAVARGQGPGRPVADRPELAVGARLSRRRPL